MVQLFINLKPSKRRLIWLILVLSSTHLIVSKFKKIHYLNNQLWKKSRENGSGWINLNAFLEMFSLLYARTMLILSNDFLDKFVLFWECPFVNSAKGRFNYVASCDFPEFLSHFSRMFKGGGNNRPLSKIHSVWFCKKFFVKQK